MPVIGPPQARVAIYDHTGALQQLDVSGDFAGGVISYTDTPYGCAGADLTLGLNYETVIARGYWSARNIVEISSGDDVVRQAITTNLAPALSGWTIASGFTASNGGPGGDADLEYTGTGSNITAGLDAYSPAVAVTPGTTYTPSWWLDASQVTHGGYDIQVQSADGTTTYADVSFTTNPNGAAAGRYAVPTWTCPVGVTSVRMRVFCWPGQSGGFIVASGQKLKFSQPMLEPKSTASAWYVPSGSSTRIYVTDTRGYDVAIGHDAMQIGLFDGSTYTGLIPVSAVGTDAASGVPYVTCSAPLAGGGNPTSIASYVPGSTIYRRRYSGLLHQPRELPNQKTPKCVVHCVGLSQRVAEAVTTFALTNGSTDIGTAMYALLSAFSGRWPELTIAAGNFPATGQTSFNGSYDRTQVSRVVGDLLKAANSNGDIWVLRVGHDRTPRLVKLFATSGSVYTYNVTLPQGVTYFEPRHFVNADQDATQLYNTVEVVGDVNPATNQPVTAIVQDPTSVSLYGQIDAPPVTNTACKTVAQCAQHGQALLDQQAAARQSARFDVSTRNDVAVSGAPMGLSRGDVVLGVHCVTVTNFEGSAPNVSGLVASAKTTLESGGEMMQQVQYASVKAPWDADIAERANALATALLKNTATALGVSASCVSADAFPTTGIPTSGLTVNYPAFLALFAQGTPVAAIAAGSFSVAASATSWAWLNSNSTWTIKQDSSVVSGAILYAIFTTSATAVIGIIQKASVGVIKLGTNQLPGAPSGTTFAGSGFSVTSYAGAGGGNVSALCAFTLTITPPGGDNRPFSQWGAGFEWWAKVNNTGSSDGDTNVANYQLVGTYADSAHSIPSSDTMGPFGAGNVYQVAARWIDQRNEPGPLVVLGLTTKQTVGTTALAPYTGGAPNVTVTSVGGRVIGTGVSATLQINFSTTDFSAQPATIREIHIVTRAHAISDTMASADFVLDWTTVAFGSPSTFTRTVRCHSGDVIDVGVYYVGVDGKPSATTWCGSGYTDPDGPFFDAADPNGTAIVHARSSLPTQKQINGNGQLLSTDFFNVTEADPTSSQAGLWISNAQYCWAKSALSLNANNGPLVMEWSGFASSQTDVGIMFGCGGGGSGTSASSPPTSGYMAYILHTGAVTLYKWGVPTAGQWNQVASVSYSGANAIYSAWSNHLRISAQIVNSALQIWVQFNGSTPLIWTDSSGSINAAGTFGLFGGSTLTHDFCAKQSLADAQNLMWAGNVDANGNIPSSAPFKVNGTLQAAVSSGGLTYTASTGSTSTGSSTVTIYWDGTNGSTIPAIHFPSQAVGVTTACAGGNYAIGSLNASTDYYFCARVNTSVSGGTPTIQIQAQAGGAAGPNTADHQWLNLDGYMPFATSLKCSTPAVNTSTGGSAPGGGGGGIQCPAVGQIMPTTRGLVRAAEIVPGDFMIGPDGTPKEVFFAESVPGCIAEVTVDYGDDRESFQVEETHLWMHAGGQWIDTLSLKLGALLEGTDGVLYPVVGLRWLGDGMFRKLRVDGCEMRMGRVIGHNVVTT